MPGAPYYAEAFSPRPGRCFRLIASQARPARPTARARGLGRLLAGPERRRYRIKACDGHRPAPDEGGRPTTSPPAGRSGGWLTGIRAPAPAALRAAADRSWAAGVTADTSGPREVFGGPKACLTWAVTSPKGAVYEQGG